MGRTSEKIFCAFCKIPRNVYTKKHITWTNVALSILASMLFMNVLWQKFNPKVSIIFVIFIAVSEAFIQIRWRLSVNCQHCGFDPVLYLKDPSKAARNVKLVLDKRKGSADYLLSEKNPFKNLEPIIIKPKLEPLPETQPEA